MKDTGAKPNNFEKEVFKVSTEVYSKFLVSDGISFVKSALVIALLSNLTRGQWKSIKLRVDNVFRNKKKNEIALKTQDGSVNLNIDNCSDLMKLKFALGEVKEDET